METSMGTPADQPLRSRVIAADYPRNWTKTIIPQQDSRWAYPVGLIYGILSGAAMLFFFDALPRMLH